MSAEDPPAALARATRALPVLEGLPWQVVPGSWQSLALDVGGAWILRFPRAPGAAAALRQEVALLAALRGATSVPLPAPALHGDPVFAAHRKIPGARLEPEAWRALPEPAKDALAADLARLLSELHGRDPERMVAAGAGPVADWAAPGAVRARALPLLSGAARAAAEEALATLAALPPDPLGAGFGHFDLHGWNMVFDHRAGRLSGVVDFGDAGIGPLSRDFVCFGFLGADLVARVAAAYEGRTGRRPGRARLDALTGYHRLSKLAQVADDAELAAYVVPYIDAWAADRLLNPETGFGAI